MSYIPPNSDNADLIFSGDYSPLLGSEANLIIGFEEEVGLLYQIWTDENYVYAAMSGVLDIYDIVSESKYAYINYSEGFNTVWANDDKVFLGTSNSGIKYIDKTCISGSVDTPLNLATCLMDFSDLTYYHNLTSKYIRYLHGNDDVICAVTNSGVDVVKIDPQGYYSHSLVNNAKKCFMTQNKFYYIVSDTYWALHRVDSTLCDWDIPDYSYITGSGILPSGEKINDIFVTESTASNGVNNTLFVATTSGIFVIDEYTLEYNIYYVEE